MNNLDIMQYGKIDPNMFNFDMASIGPMYSYLSQEDIDRLKYIATSGRLNGKIQKKYKMIDEVMRSRGFRKFAAGTNRVVYAFYEDPRFLVKIAVDRVGMKDNPLEYYNQTFLKPFVTKMFYVSPCGTVGFAERVIPIRSVEEFKIIAGDVFDVLMTKIIGKYVVDDVGTKYFRNWGIREGFGPVLLDYPYVYDLDGSKLYCNSFIPEKGAPCGGEIDYDAGLNHLCCTCCGKPYTAKDLEDKTKDNLIVIKRGGDLMKAIFIDRDGTVYGSDIDSTSVINKKEFKKKNTTPKAPEIVVSDGYKVYGIDLEGDNEEEKATSSDPSEKILEPNVTKEEFEDSIPRPTLIPIDDEDDEDEECENAETESEVQDQIDAGSGTATAQDQNMEERANHSSVEKTDTEDEGSTDSVSERDNQPAGEIEETSDREEDSEIESDVSSGDSDVSEADTDQNKSYEESEETDEGDGVTDEDQPPKKKRAYTNPSYVAIAHRDSKGRFTNKDEEGAKQCIVVHPGDKSKENEEASFEATPTVKRMTSSKAEERKKLGRVDKDKKNIKRIPQ